MNSRQSSCLTNFLLSGRSVMLEMVGLPPLLLHHLPDASIMLLLWASGMNTCSQVKRTSNTKIISHMLTSHGGEIFIHTLSCCRSTLEDPPRCH